MSGTRTIGRIGIMSSICTNGSSNCASADDAADLLPDLDPDLVEDLFGVAADPVLVDRLFALLVLDQHHPFKLPHLLAADEVGAVLGHVVDQLVGDALEGEHLLLRDAGEVVVKGAAVDDVPARLLDVGRVVDDDGGLPAPAPIAFLPDESTARTTPGPPVQQIMRTLGDFIMMSEVSIVGFLTATARFSGAPTERAARLTRSTA